MCTRVDFANIVKLYEISKKISRFQDIFLKTAVFLFSFKLMIGKLLLGTFFKHKLSFHKFL